ncbi:MAG: calmodulin-binding-domain-containing protein, partial [Olpidium bornovanus]
EARAPEKKAKYRSKFSSQARAEHRAGRREAAGMGPPAVTKERPDAFLKKHAGEERLKEREFSFFSMPASVTAGAARKPHHNATVVGPLRPPVPKHDELGKVLPQTKKDFIRLNALENIHSSACRYVRKPDYGRPPEYLVKRKAEAAEARRKLAAEAEQAAEAAGGGGGGGLVLLPEEERVAVLDGLKKNWERLNTDYQKLSLTVDTVPKIARKVNMESQLKRLEDDIQKFSVPNVFVDFYD